jgi:threonine/homoserine/homoserine lactone efflux protein
MFRSVIAFSALAALLTIAPGPDFVLVVRTAIGYDRKCAVAVSLGICSGLFVWALVSAIGVAAVVTASAVAYTALRVAGGAYLLWLGISAIRHAGRGDDVATPNSTPRFRSSVHAFRTGLINNILNPKVGVFYVTAVPTFVPDDAPVLLVSLLLASIHVVMGVAWLVGVAVLVDRVRVLLTRRRAQRRLERASGAALMGFGVAIAIDAAR